MDIFISILFLFASLGVINGILVGLFLWFKKKKSLTDFYLGGLLLVLSVRIGKSVFFYFAGGGADKLILQIGLSACVFIGPFFYLYIRSIYAKEHKKFSKYLLITLLIGIISIGVIFPYRTYPEIWSRYIIHGIYAVWVVFVVLGIYLWINRVKTSKFSLRTSLKDQVFVILVALSFITVTYLCALYVSGFTYIWGAVAFTIFFYYMMVNVLLNKGVATVEPKISDPIENASLLLEKLDQLMENEELFLNPKLKLNDLADAFKLNRNLLSRLLNEEYNYGFSNYVNEFRVNRSIALIQSRPELSLEGIGYEAGFNSKSSFFAAFKKISSCTPSQFKKQLKPA